MKIFLSAVLAGVLFVSFSAQAQSPKQAEQMASRLESIRTELSATASALLDMAGGTSNDAEQSALMEIYDSVIRFKTPADQTLLVAQIYTILIDKTDQANVKKFLVVVAKPVPASADSSVKNINRYLPRLQSPAAITEAQTARASILKIKDEVERNMRIQN